jgi:hypothetical protein
MVVEFIASLNVAVSFWLVPAPIEVSTGFVEVTKGAVVFVLAPVVKVHVWGLASGERAALRAAVVSVAVNVVLVAKVPAVGAKTAILLVAS